MTRSRLPKTGLGFFSPKTQKFYTQTRPKKMISEFIKKRFYFPLQVIKRLFEASQHESIYMVMTGKTWNGIDLHLQVRKRKNAKGVDQTSIRLQVEKERWKWEYTETNYSEFWGLLFYCFLRWPKTNLVEIIRLGRTTIIERQRFQEDLLPLLKQTIPNVSAHTPFDLEKGLPPSLLLDFFNAPSKRQFLQKISQVA